MTNHGPCRSMSRGRFKCHAIEMWIIVVLILIKIVGVLQFFAHLLLITVYFRFFANYFKPKIWVVCHLIHTSRHSKTPLLKAFYSVRINLLRVYFDQNIHFFIKWVPIIIALKLEAKISLLQLVLKYTVSKLFWHGFSVQICGIIFQNLVRRLLKAVSQLCR